MNTTTQKPREASLNPLQKQSTNPIFLTGFHSIAPKYISGQDTLLNWLVNAHARTGGVSLSELSKQFGHYSASSTAVAQRGHELEDFTHEHWNDMRLFGPNGSNLAQKTQFFDERVRNMFSRFYPIEAPSPKAIIHVTCTGYTSPSGAQHLVSERAWGKQTEVLHAYHMGCYAAHPAIRIAAGLQADVVHTELCSLHLDVTRHEPAQIVIQSLFADGFIKYQVTEELDGQDGLEILAARDEIIPHSTQAMSWATGPFHFTMALSKEVPVLMASVLPRFAKSLFEEAGLYWDREKARAVFAIHPGGPRIIELSQKILGLEDRQVRWSHDVLRQHGNMSSATLPHIWRQILLDEEIANGTPILSIGAGPGLTLSGMLFQVCKIPPFGPFHFRRRSI